MASWAGDPSFDLFQLPEEHQELRTAIRALSEKEIAPYAADVDENARFPEEALQALGGEKFLAVTDRAIQILTQHAQFEDAEGREQVVLG